MTVKKKKKKSCDIVNFAVLADHRVKLKESEKKDKYKDIAGELKKTMSHESDDDINCNWHSWYSHQKIGTETGGLRNKRTSGDHPNYGIIEISQNTEKSPGDFRRLADPLTLMKYHQLALVWKSQRVKI